MKPLSQLLDQNRKWAASMKEQDPEFFKKLSEQQSPQYLWIGCSDSRVPANQITGLMPGEVFVHRNVGNLVLHTDFNCLSVLQYAVAVLRVKHIILCGHYGCGAMRAALGNSQLGLIDNWLRTIKDTYSKYESDLLEIENQQTRMDRLCELNVVEQVNNICHTTIVQQAWSAGQELSVHGWIYGVVNGRLKDLNVTISRQDEIDSIYRMARNLDLLDAVS